MKGPGVAPSGILDRQKEFVKCCHKIETYRRAHFLMSPVDFLKKVLFSGSLEQRMDELGVGLFDIYWPILAHLFSKFAIPSYTEENWKFEVVTELFNQATILEGKYGLFSREFWSIVCSGLNLTSLAPEIRRRWKTKFLLLQFLGEMKGGAHKQDLWVLAYGAKAASSDPSIPPRQLCRQSYDSFFDALSRHFNKLRQYADFSEQDLDAVRNRDKAQLELWLLPE